MVSLKDTEENRTMEEEERAQIEAKNRRIAVGATVGGVLVILFLLIVLIIQFVQIGVGAAESNRLDKEIEAYNQKIENEEGILDEYLTGDALYWRAIMQGWKKK